jgi:hypothetical protein
VKSFAEIAAATGVPETKVREIAGHLDALGWRAKLTADDVQEIRRLCAARWTLKDVAAKFGIGRLWVAKIRDREAWRHVE